MTCPGLGYVQKGRIIPESCSVGEARPGDKCKIYCRKGFKPLRDVHYLTCDDNLQWNPPMNEIELINICVEGKFNIALFKS